MRHGKPHEGLFFEGKGDKYLIQEVQRTLYRATRLPGKPRFLVSCS